MTGTPSLDSKVDSSGGDQWRPLHSAPGGGGVGGVAGEQCMLLQYSLNWCC